MTQPFGRSPLTNVAFWSWVCLAVEAVWIALTFGYFFLADRGGPLAGLGDLGMALLALFAGFAGVFLLSAAGTVVGIAGRRSVLGTAALSLHVLVLLALAFALLRGFFAGR